MHMELDAADLGRRLPEEMIPYFRFWSAKFRVLVQAAAAELRRGNHQGQVMRWVHDTSKEPGSFLWMCDLFDLPPDRVLDKLYDNLKGR